MAGNSAERAKIRAGANTWAHIISESDRQKWVKGMLATLDAVSLYSGVSSLHGKFSEICKNIVIEKEMAIIQRSTDFVSYTNALESLKTELLNDLVRVKIFFF